jgi:hypothetical protein
VCSPDGTQSSRIETFVGPLDPPAFAALVPWSLSLPPQAETTDASTQMTDNA